MKGLIGRAAGALVALFFIAFTAQAAEPEAVPGEYVVQLKSVEKNIGILSQELGSFVKQTHYESGFIVVQRPVVESQKAAVQFLKSKRIVANAEPNFIYRVNKTPNDAMYEQLWGLHNKGQADSAGQVGTEGVDIGAEAAWDIQTGSDKTLIAVIDTGVDYNNADLKDNIWVNEAEMNGKEGVDDDGNGIVDDIHGASFINGVASGDPIDDHGHGSHCSGTIGGTGDNNQGVVGVNWKTKIMGVKFLDKNGSGSLADAILAIDYATKMGAKIMSNSWGGGGFSEELKKAIERSNAAGALFVAAAGNDSNNNDSNPTYPATYDVANVLAVAAVDNKGQLASFSNYGKSKVHVGAPGVRILSTTLDGTFNSWSGTSMATPHVSGVAGLLLSAFPEMTNLQMKERIIATARPIATLKNKVKSNGIVNADFALRNYIPPPDMNDPEQWQTVTANVSTEHPYPLNMEQTYEVKVDGAKEIAIYFSKFETETRYDIVKIYSSNGNLMQTLTGNNSESFSVVIPGSSAKIVLQSDDSVNAYGFDITKIAWR